MNVMQTRRAIGIGFGVSLLILLLLYPLASISKEKLVRVMTCKGEGEWTDAEPAPRYYSKYFRYPDKARSMDDLSGKAKLSFGRHIGVIDSSKSQCLVFRDVPISKVGTSAVPEKKWQRDWDIVQGRYRHLGGVKIFGRNYFVDDWEPEYLKQDRWSELKSEMTKQPRQSSNNMYNPAALGGELWDEEVSPEAKGKLTAWMKQNDISASRNLASTLALIVQTALALQNFDPGPRDGALGPKTIAAVLAWQAMAGWAASGDLAGTLNAVLRTALALQGYQLDPDSHLFGRHAHKIIDSWGNQHGSALGTTDRDEQFWGAIAYSRSRGGWSASSTSGRAHRAIAVRAALDRCRKRKWGDNCKEILVFSDECGAFAIGRARSYGVATGRTRSQAERNALSECRRVDTNCQVRTKLSTCNPAVDRFQSESLSDVHVTVLAGQRKVELCVRDHECEDGDRISVSVNGAQVFSGELGSSWSCQQVPVEPGANLISMFAINGTGFKGSCSHDNVNTGEMRVTGTSSAIQSWRHRGGSGSNARLIVQVQ